MASHKRKPLSELPSGCNGLVAGGKKARLTNHVKDESLEDRRAGTIHCITLRNFMCHSLLEVNLQSKGATVIVGRNGSGKSAILTALVVGLGGKASLTNRGSSVRNFVKAGCSSGSVEIELHNVGPMAYKPHLYGECIRVQRNFSANTGASTYRIRSANGEVVATQARQLQHITSALNIQVDNPICILNQDTSRNFLNTSNAHHRFQLFLKATKLDELAEQYSQLEKNKRDSTELLDEKKKSFAKLEEELNRLRTKVENYRSIAELHERIKLLQLELEWAKARDAEHEVQQLQRAIDELQIKVDRIETGALQRDQLVQEINDKISVLNKELNDVQAAIQTQSAPQAEVKRALEALHNTFQQHNNELLLITSSINSKRRDLDMLQKNIENAKENAERVAREKEQRLQTIERLTGKIRDTDAQLQTCRNDLFQLRSDFSKRDSSQSELRTEMRLCETQLATSREQLNAARQQEQQGDSASNHVLLLYGNQIPHLCRTIKENAHKFQYPPLGPIGSHVKVKDRKWAVAVEGFLGRGLLNAFIVDNARDNQVLQNLMNRIDWPSNGGPKPSIITTKFIRVKHDVRRNLVRAPSDCTSIYEAIEVDDAVVSNCVVDQAAIEGILLVANTDRAIELMSDERRVPRNCTQAVTATGDRYYPDPRYKTYGSRYHRAQFLQVDRSEMLRQLQQKVDDAMKRRQTLQEQLEAQRASNSHLERQQSDLEEKVRKLQMYRTQVRQKLDDVQNTYDPEAADITILKNELIEVRRTMEERACRQTALSEQIQKVQKQMDEHQSRLDELKLSVRGMEDRKSPLIQQLSDLGVRHKELTLTAQQDTINRAKLKEQHDNITAQLKQKSAALKEARAQAESLGAWPPLDQPGTSSSSSSNSQELRPIPRIVSELTSMERKVRRAQLDMDNVDEIVARYEELNTKRNVVVELLEKLAEDVQQLTKAARKRNRYYKLTENYFVTYIKYAFKKMMDSRQFQGQLDVNLEAATLEMNVIPQQGSQGLTATANLSGGERSFSTVAFLYALWQCMDFPFYFLDEFDVYMDKLNRSKVLDILIEHTRNHPTLQFVFLTPQDVSGLADDVTLLRLADPERRSQQ